MAPLCLVLPPGLQALLCATGLIRQLSTMGRVLVCLELTHLPHLQRLFHGTRVTFWFDEPDADTRAAALGYKVLHLPELPKEMYEAVDLAPKHMHSSWFLLRDTARETELLESVTCAYGPTYVLTWGGERMRDTLFPGGIPVVDAASLCVDSPFDYCGIMQHALQVHATDSWFLTLADLVGGESRKFCHAYASSAPVARCRRKYRRRVSIVCTRSPSDFFSDT